MRQDIRFAVRAFRRQPALYSTAALGLALAIGISTAIFSLVNVSAIRGFGVRDPATAFVISLDNALRSPENRGGYASAWAEADLLTLRAAAASAEIAAQQQWSARLGDTSGAEPPAPLDAVTGNYFGVLRGRPFAGRLLEWRDDVPGSNHVVVLSHAFWLRQLGGDASVIGREITIEGLQFIVSGIAEQGFSGVPTPSQRAPAFWIPLSAAADLFEATRVEEARDRRRRLAALRRQSALTPQDRERLRTLEALTRASLPVWTPSPVVLARPKDGVSVARFTGELETIARAIGVSRGQAPAAGRTALQLRSIEELQASSALADMIVMLMGAAVLVMALAGANLTNALLAAALGRRRDVGVHLVLGASRWRVLRQSLVESLMIAAAGGAGGWLLAGWVAPVFGAVWVTDPLIDFAPDRTVSVYALGMTMAIAIAGGIIPARQSGRTDVISALKADQQAAPGVRSAIRSVLIGAQAALSIVVLLTAALLARSLHHAATLDVGVDLDRLARIEIGLAEYDDARAEAYWAAARERIQQLPGVARVALASSVPFDGSTLPIRLTNGRGALHVGVVDAAYFETLQLRVLRGRTFTPDEVRSHASVAVIPERIAREFWGDTDPVGDTLQRVWGTPPESANPSYQPNVRVVGVVSDAVKQLHRAERPFVYQPLSDPIQYYQLVIRAETDAAVIATPALAALRSLDPEQRPRVHLLQDAWRQQLDWPARHATLGSVVAITALGLAVVGLVGVATFAARQRRHEVSVRTALGARPADVVRLLCAQSLRPVAIGLALGALASFWITPLLERYVAGYGISVYDPIAFASGILVLLGTAALATFVPARRAARADPAQLLRSN